MSGALKDAPRLDRETPAPVPQVRPLKIAQIGSRGIPGHHGGVERVVEAIAPRLAAMGHAVTVYCASWSPSREPSYKGVTLRYVRTPKAKYLDTFARSFVATLCEMVSGGDIVHFHGSGSAPLALLARLAGKRVIVTVHGLDWQRRKWNVFGRWFLQAGEYAALKLPHRTVVVGPDLKTKLEEAYGIPVTFIANGVEARPHRAPDKIRAFGVSSRDYVLYLARLVPEKQPHVLIEAWRSLSDRGGRKLIIAGPTWHSQDYVARLREMAAGDPSITITGAVDEETLEELYSNCLCYVLPSEVEGMSLSLLDAMAFGACIIASDIPANADVILDTGLTFKVGEPGDLARRLSEVMSDEALAGRLRVAARARMDQEFSWDRIAEQWDKLYQDVMGPE